jgi:cell division protein FtsL
MSRVDLWLTALLLVAVVVSGVAVVHAKYQSRQLFVALQDLRRDRDDVAMEWGRLQLELGTVGNHALMEKMARKRLGMRMPGPADVVVLER